MESAKRKELQEILIKYSYEKKAVTLASGRQSQFYFDGKQTTLRPEGARLIGEGMWEILRTHFPQVQAVGGPTLGADPLVTTLSLTALQKGVALPAFIVRKAAKSHGTMQWIEGAKHLRLGMRVVLLEDVITTGGSLLKAVRHVREAGLVVVGSIVLVDRQEGGKENLESEGIAVYSLFTKSDFGIDE